MSGLAVFMSIFLSSDGTSWRIYFDDSVHTLKLVQRNTTLTSLNIISGNLLHIFSCLTNIIRERKFQPFRCQIACHRSERANGFHYYTIGELVPC